MQSDHHCWKVFEEDIIKQERCLPKIVKTLKITSINSSLKPLERTSTVIDASQMACPWLLKLLKINLKQKTATAVSL